MAEVREIRLPGVGVRHDFTTRGGRQLGVLVHHGGHRDLLIFDAQDPDRTAASLRLDDDESRTLAELLGASQVTRTVHDVQQTIEGLTIDWLPIPSTSPYARKSIGDTQLRRRTGVSIVAIIRGDTTVPAPGPDERLYAGDTVVVVGTPEGLQQAVDLLGA